MAKQIKLVQEKNALALGVLVDFKLHWDVGNRKLKAVSKDCKKTYFFEWGDDLILKEVLNERK